MTKAKPASNNFSRRSSLFYLRTILQLSIRFNVSAYHSPCQWYHEQPLLRNSLLLTQRGACGIPTARRIGSCCLFAYIDTSFEETIGTPPQRKPNYYWNDIENVRRELAEFWENLNITSFPRDTPPIPSESLLSHFQRYDLRRVISKYGGREDLSYELGGAEIVPGKWKESVRNCRIVQELLRNASHGLKADTPPLSPQQKRARLEAPCENTFKHQSFSSRWAYKNKDARRPKKYWSLTQVIESLYEHLDKVRINQNRPAVWMPRPAEIKEAGREDLFHAIARFGGSSKITEIAGLVGFHEWSYFEGQLELMNDLTKYLDEYHGGDRMLFPLCTEIKERRRMPLYYAIQRYGGRKFLMSRFSMVNNPSRVSRKSVEMNFGSFSLDFAISLLEFIRSDHLEQKAPLDPAVIGMPTEYVLFQHGRNDLIEGVQKYGGYENVARRLGLAYFECISSNRNEKVVRRR